MKRIAKILQKDNFIPELGYIVITSEGMIAYNGQIGVRYDRETSGERLCLIADKVGAYAIPEPLKFLRTISALEGITAVELSEADSSITIKFAGKGSLQIPVVLKLSKSIPQLAIEWKTLDEAKTQGIEITSLWDEVTALTTNEGQQLWGDVIGIYGSEGKLVSFDYGVYLNSDDIQAPDFYCPRSLLDLGLKNMEVAAINGDILLIVGQKVQYVCTGVDKSDIVSNMMHLKEDFSAGDIKKVTLDFTSGLWKRAKLFASAVLTFAVKNGEIYIKHSTWEECIGKTEAPDAEFTTRISLLERWASGTFEHSISIGADGTWNLYGKTRSDMNFYAVLTNIENPTDVKIPEQETANFMDFGEGETIL